MPATPLFSHRLENGIHELEAIMTDWIDRRTLQEVLGVSKWTAWRIFKRCGAQEGPGASLICQRTKLIDQLRALQTDGRFAAETARRLRVEQYLDGMIRYASSKHKEIARNEAAVDLLSSRFARLPPGVELRPGELRIQFLGTDDFLRKIGAVVFALNNDFEAISEFLHSTTTGSSLP